MSTERVAVLLEQIGPAEGSRFDLGAPELVERGQVQYVRVPVLPAGSHDAGFLLFRLDELLAYVDLELSNPSNPGWFPGDVGGGAVAELISEILDTTTLPAGFEREIPLDVSDEDDWPRR
jgi:hypothetical protein